MKLRDKIAIVMGSSRGIGKAIAFAFAKEGADVVVAARTETEIPHLPGTIYQTAEEIKALGRRALAIRTNVAVDEDVENMVHKTLGEFGRIDILVCKASVNYYATVADTPWNRLDLILKVNLRGKMLCTKAVLPTMVEQKSGNIIIISSGAGRRANPGDVAYSVADAGLEYFARGLAEEVKEHNIIVNAIMLEKAINTEGMRFFRPDADKSQWLPPEVMGEAALFLATRDTSFTGKALLYDELRAQYALG